MYLCQIRDPQHLHCDFFSTKVMFHILLLQHKLQPQEIKKK